MSEIKQTFTGDASQLEAEYQKLKKAAEQQGDALDWLAKQAEQTAEIQGKSSRAAAKAYEEAAKQASKAGQAQEAAGKAAQQLSSIDKQRADQLIKYHRQESQFASQDQQNLLKKAQQVRQLGQAEADSAKAAAKAAREKEGQVSLMDSLVAKAGGYLATWVSIEAILSAASRHMEEIKRSQEESLNSAMAISSLEAQTVLNAPGRTSAENQKFAAEIEKIQKESGFGGGPNASGRQLLLAAANRTESVTSATQETTLKALRQAARLTVNNPEQAQELAPSIASLMQSFNISEQTAANYILKFGKIARPSQLGDQAKMLERAMITGQSTANTTDPEQQLRGAISNAAMTAALSKFADDEGDTSSTAGINLDVAMANFFKKGIDLKVGDKTLHMPLVDPGNAESRLAALRQNKFLADQFEESAPFGRKRFQMPFHQIVSGGTFQKYYEEGLAELSSSTNVVPQAEHDVRNATPILKAATAFNRQKAINEIASLTDNYKQRWGQARKNVAEMRSQTAGGVSFNPINSAIYGAADWMYSDPEAYERDLTRARLGEVLSLKQDPFQTKHTQAAARRAEEYLRTQLERLDPKGAKEHFEAAANNGLSESSFYAGTGTGSRTGAALRRQFPNDPVAQLEARLADLEKQPNNPGIDSAEERLKEVIQVLKDIYNRMNEEQQASLGLAPAAAGERGANREK